MWKQNWDQFRELKTNNHKGVCTESKTHTSTTQVCWVFWLSFPIHWQEYPILNSSGPMPPPRFSEPPCTLSVVSEATEPVNFTGVPCSRRGRVPSGDVPVATSRLCGRSCPLSPWLSLGQPPCSSAFCTAPQRDFPASKLSNNYCFTTISVSVLLTLIVIHCKIHSGKAPGVFLPSLPISEALNPLTPWPGAEIGLCRSLAHPASNKKHFSACSVLANQPSPFGLSAEVAGRGADPSAALSIDGSKRLLLSQRRARGGSGGNTAPALWQTPSIHRGEQPPLGRERPAVPSPQSTGTQRTLQYNGPVCSQYVCGRSIQN